MAKRSPKGGTKSDRSDASGDNQEAVDGCDEVINKLKAIEAAINLGAGIEYYDEERDDGLTNKQILEFQAMGRWRSDGQFVSRDILPGAEDDDKMGVAFETKFVAMIDKLEARDVDEKKAAMQATASALRDAARVVVKEIERRFVEQTDVNGHRLITVLPEYADRRAETHHIDQLIVLQRTGQLARGIKEGRYKLYIDPSKVAKIKGEVMS